MGLVNLTRYLSHYVSYVSGKSLELESADTGWRHASWRIQSVEWTLMKRLPNTNLRIKEGSTCSVLQCAKKSLRRIPRNTESRDYQPDICQKRMLTKEKLRVLAASAVALYHISVGLGMFLWAEAFSISAKGAVLFDICITDYAAVPVFHTIQLVRKFD